MQGNLDGWSLNERNIVRIIGHAQVAPTPFTPDLANEHLCITALLYGWDHICAQQDLPPRRKTYRSIEESLAPSKDFATRLSMCLLLKIWRVSHLSRDMDESTQL